MTGRPLTTDQMVAIAKETETLVRTALAPMVERLTLEGACPCCIGRGIAGGLGRLLGEYGSYTIGTDADIERIMDLARYALVMEVDARALELPGPIPVSDLLLADGGTRAH